MASKALLTPEQYLSTHYEREPEYVHGELVEKSLPTRKHSRVQHRLSVLLDRVGYCCPELRVKLAADLYRVPDFALYESDPAMELPDFPPVLIVEVKSPDDRPADALQKFVEYKTWGVHELWYVDPETEKLYVFDGALREVDRLSLPQFNLTIAAADLFD